MVETFHDADPAVDWYGTEIRKHAERFDGDHAKDPQVIAEVLDGARETIKGERDVVGGWWGNNGATFFAIHLIACPNFWRPEHRCPVGLR
ncbi:hypothetical protein AB8O64_30050 [Streptomyces sp. QH1-20]|uniref:hypothetical protein n=1 Tax=Streptomyces sp. QH1-20 TaxID=3240934 RepID=UPI003513E652